MHGIGKSFSTKTRTLRPKWLTRRRALALAAVLVAATAGIVGLAWYAHKTVMDAGNGRIFALNDAPTANVALVFGARVYDGGDVSWPLKWRLEAARQLYENGQVKRILVSGDNRWENYSEPQVMKQWLVDNGVPEDRIACDYAGRRTFDSCARAACLWGIRGDVILVSQFYHLPRALFLARSWGMDAVAVAAEKGTFPRDLLRERLARVKAWLDVNVFATEPTRWGKPEKWPDAVSLRAKLRQ